MDGKDQEYDPVLVDVLSSIADYIPVIPDELSEYYLNKGGFQCPDLRATRLISIATQKFISEIVNDAYQLCKLRQTAPIKEKRDKYSKDKGLILTTEDLILALREYGINVDRQEYYADSLMDGVSSENKEEEED